MATNQALHARKKPKQERSKATVDAILTAGAQVLVEEGAAAATTNRIAKRAGVSVGSLYQYFPNKEAILVAVGQDLADRQMQVMASKLSEIVDAPLEEAVRHVITALIDAKRIEPELTRIIFQEVHRLQDSDPVGDWLRQCEGLVQATLEARPDDVCCKDARLVAFVATHAVHGIISGMLFHEPEYLADERLIDETVELIIEYLRPTHAHDGAGNETP